MVKTKSSTESSRMGRPPLNYQATMVRFPKETLERMDRLVGVKQRAIFIREAVEARLKYAEELKKISSPKE